MNIRVFIFVLVALALIGFPAYVFLDEKISGGIKDRGDYVEVNLKAMSDFELDQEGGRTEDVPAKWRALDGKKVLLTGEMWAGNNASPTAPQFELVYSIAKCCFSGVPLKQHFVLSRLPEGRQVEIYSGQVRVMGTLHVKVDHEGGKVSRVYTLDVAQIDPV
jgi:hypothetical protein